LCRVLNDRDDSLEFFGCDLTGSARISIICSSDQLLPHLPLVQVDIGLLADQVGVSSANTLDFGQGVHDLLLAIDIGIEETQDELNCALLVRFVAGQVNILTVRLLSRDERHD